MKKIFFSVLIFFLKTGAVYATENQANLPASKNVFYNFDQNIIQSYTNGFGIYHTSAAGLTYALVKGGIDWDYFSYMKANKYVSQAGFASVITGGLVPLTIPFYLFFKGRADENPKLIYTSLALGQSVMISLLVSSAYKAVTGRDEPELDNRENRNNYSRNFNFGFMRRGIFDGWPSGHATNAFAMAATVMEMYPGNVNVRVYSGLYAMLIGLGISTNIHWFSDFVAGALIGYSIGSSVGRSFRNLYEGKKQESRTSFYLTPAGFGVMVLF
jgi:membrane-associated phospholipid phosphatase